MYTTGAFGNSTLGTTCAVQTICKFTPVHSGTAFPNVQLSHAKIEQIYKPSSDNNSDVLYLVDPILIILYLIIPINWIQF